MLLFALTEPIFEGSLNDVNHDFKMSAFGEEPDLFFVLSFFSVVSSTGSSGLGDTASALR